MADTIGKISTLKGELRAATEQAQSLAYTFKQLDEAGLITSKKEFKELQNQVDEAKSKVAGLRDQIKDTNEQINVLTAGSKFEVMGNSIKDVVGKIASMDFEGASESATRLLKISKNINFVDAIKGIKDIGLTFVKLGVALMTNPLFLIAGAIAAAVYAMGGLSKIIDGVSAKDEERLETLKQQAAASKEQLDSIGAQEERLKANGMSEEEILQLKIDAARVAAADAKAQIEAQKRVRDEQIAAAERNKKILSGILQFITAPIQGLLWGIDQLTEKLKQVGIISEETYATVGNLRDRFNDRVTSLIFDPEETKKEGDAAVKEAEKNYIALDNQLAGFENRQKANRKKAAQDDAKDQKAIDDKKLADGMAAREAYAKANMDAQENELFELQKAQEKQLAEFTGTEEERLLLLESYRIKEEEIMAKYDQIAADADQKAREEKAAAEQKAADDALALRQKELEDKILGQQTILENENNSFEQRKLALDNLMMLELSNTELTENEKLAIEKYYSEERKKLAEDEANFKANRILAGLDIAGDALSILSSLNEASTKGDEASQRKAFERNKKIQKANVLINTAAAVIAQLAVPQDALTGANFIKSAAAAAAGGAALVKINQTQFESGSTPGGGPGPTGTQPTLSFGATNNSAATPAFNLFGQNNNANTLNAAGQPVGGQPQPLAIQVSVSETEITQTQNFVRRVSESAVL